MLTAKQNLGEYAAKPLLSGLGINDVFGLLCMQARLWRASREY